jgi:hypothetical protein
MGKSTISTGPFSIAFCMFTRPGNYRFITIKSPFSYGFPMVFLLHGFLASMANEPMNRERSVLHGLVQVLQQRHRLQVGDVAVFVGDPLAVLLSKDAVDPPWKKPWDEKLLCIECSYIL